MKIKFCLTCIFLCVIFSINAQSNFLDLFEKARFCEQEKKFTEASVLYERIIFDAEDDTTLCNAILGQINCYKQQNNFISAYNFSQKNSTVILNDSLKYLIFEQWIVCAYLSNKLEQCINLIEQAKIYFPNSANINRLALFKILCLNEELKWVEAKATLNEWLANNKIDSLSTNLYQKIPKLKSVKKAEVLSTFMPGSGQFYANKPLEGIASIILHGLCLYYGVYSFQEKYFFSAWIFGGGFINAFHKGGITRAKELVRVYNLKKSAFYNENTRQKIIGIMQPYL